MTQNAFTVKSPVRRTSGVVFASPHSGCDYPDWLLKRSVLNAHNIRSSEDAFVDKLFAAAPQFGAPFLCARTPRAMVDFNRSCDELDPALIHGVRSVGNNPRVASGLGVIPRVVSNGRAIYRGKLSMQEAELRIADIWRPYHQTLQALLADAHRAFGQALLIDCHSMPREALNSFCKGHEKRPEIVLGDRFGSSASEEIVDQIEASFVRAGFVVSRNVPFAGAYIAQHYGRVSRQQHVVQVEIDRSLYMDEQLITPHEGFADMQSRLTEVIAEVAQIGGLPQRLAAE